MSRTRVGIGVAIVAVASYLAVDPGVRADLAARALAESWPYLLALFAFAATLAAIVDLRRLLGALLIAATAAAALMYRWASPSLIDYWPLAVAAAGAGIALSGPREAQSRHALSLAWTTRSAPRGELPKRFRATCVLGSLHLDLRDTIPPHNASISVTTYLGYIKLKIPVNWDLEVDAEAPPWSRSMNEADATTSPPRRSCCDRVE